MSRNVYLKQNVICEPLYNQWYAWPFIISPATAAMYVANHHIKVLQSFVTAPQVHVATLKNPGMIGGPFINYGIDRVAAIQSLLEKTRREQADIIAFAAALTQLSETVTRDATGMSLAPFYPQVPDLLRGYVELVYDLHNRASVRVFEGLLYVSPFYKAGNQSIALSLLDRDDRSFALSTPKLESEEALMLPLPFASPVIDELAKARMTPKPLEFFKELLCLPDSQTKFLSSLFTNESPDEGATGYTGPGVRLRYFGHACILIETGSTSILIDPFVAYNVADGSPRFSLNDLPPVIDYVVLTHNHQDHVLLETLLQIRHQVRTVVVPRNNGGSLADPSLKLLLKHLGFRNVIALEELEVIELPGGSLTALPFIGEHGDLDIHAKAAHLIKIENRTILCAADSNNLEPLLYTRLGELIGHVDVLFLGMECDGAPLSWLYGPLLTRPLLRKQDQSRRLDGCDASRALRIVDELRPDHVYVYAMGAEPWVTFIRSIQYTDDSRPIIESDRLVKECRERGLESERLYLKKEVVLA